MSKSSFWLLCHSLLWSPGLQRCSLYPSTLFPRKIVPKPSLLTLLLPLPSFLLRLESLHDENFSVLSTSVPASIAPHPAKSAPKTIAIHLPIWPHIPYAATLPCKIISGTSSWAGSSPQLDPHVPSQKDQPHPPLLSNMNPPVIL